MSEDHQGPRRRNGLCADLRLSRRAAVEAATWSFIGLAGAARPALASEIATPRSGFAKAKRCLFCFMWGGPSQLDTWDMKPNAPAEIRGEFKPIATDVPGTSISEHFPMLAKWARHYAIIRSMTHDDPAHLSSAHHILTGHYAPKRFSDADPPSPKDFPHLGSVLAKMRPSPAGLPGFVMIPWIVSHPAAPGGRAPGQNGGFLGGAFHPFTVPDPNPAGAGVPGVILPSELPTPRFHARQQLLKGMNAAQGNAASVAWDDLNERAFGMIGGASARGAFALSQEPDRVRDRYGRNTHGQSLLLARRLLEAGVPLVTVNWHDDHQNFWDTHGDNFNQLKKRLMPTADRALSAVFEDLQGRGMLDDTLVVWVGEFGRRPTISANVAGREHWPRCYSAVLAGGGVRGGAIYGSSDRIGAFPHENPTSPSDLAATVLHSLGVPDDIELVDALGVPRRLYNGTPLFPLFS